MLWTVHRRQVSKTTFFEIPSYLQNRVHEIIRFLKLKSRATDISYSTDDDRCRLVFAFAKAKDSKEDIGIWVSEYLSDERRKPITFYRNSWQSKV